MASILTADLPSDDELDDDFDPSKDEGGSDTEKKRSSAGKKRLRHRGPLASRAADTEHSDEVCHYLLGSSFRNTVALACTLPLYCS